jgi:uncharacterized membrane protein
MKRPSEKNYHDLFIAGLVAKAFIAIGEIASGLVFAFFSYDSLYRAAFFLFGGELMEQPRDLLWNYVIAAFGGFTSTPRSVWVVIFLSHGVVKLLLLAGLWRNKAWAYPGSLVVFTLFIFYQLYQISLTPSLALWVITAVDVLVVLLIVHEYRHRKRIVAGI